MALFSGLSNNIWKIKIFLIILSVVKRILRKAKALFFKFFNFFLIFHTSQV